MKRRSFLRTGTAAGAALTLLPGRLAGRPQEDDHSGRFPLSEITIAELQAGMRSGDLTARSATELYLRRIQQIDQAGPRLDAVIELNPDVQAIADRLDAERGAGKVRGLMHGIPVLIKDNIDTADRMQTTAGSLAMEGHIAARDAFVVERLRAAGAVILGKTNLSEWANFRSTNSTSGWSSRGGQTKNPYFLDRNPSGSSSGSAVAVSANLCAVAVGTETDGSVTSPASANGLVGIKPTVGLVSRSGIIPISSTQDTAGPMARTVADAAILLGVMAGIDERDPATKGSGGERDYTRFLDPDGLRGKRIGIEAKPQSGNRYINALFAEAVQTMKREGAEIVEVSFMEAFSELGDAEYLVLQYEFKETLNRYLAGTSAPVRTLADLIAFNKADPERMMAYFGQEILELSETRGGLETPEYLDALARSRDGSREIIDRVLREDRLDTICGITAGPACSTDLIYGDRWGDVSLTSPAAAAGYPHITVPCGLVHGLPVGLSFFAGVWQEGRLIEAGYSYEQGSAKRVVPGLRERFG